MQSLWVLLPVCIVLLIWFVYMILYSQWFLFKDYWFMSATMVFGSFIAGASSEGGGAIAFPVMTLIFDITPEVARNFSLAIQSVGMSAASYLIIKQNYPVEVRYLFPVSAGGIVGITIGTIFLAPHVPSAYAKMLFVAFWLSFGIVLYYVNNIYRRKVVERLPLLPNSELLQLGIVGTLGGLLSAILGSGIDIFSFSYVTMRYHLSEKVATPTSVVAMAINAVFGFLLHLFLVGDISSETFNYWIVSIPVVLIGAPMGAYFINNKTRAFVAGLLYVIILAQFIGGILIIQPTGFLLAFTIIVLLSGLLFFFVFARVFLKKKTPDVIT